MCFCYRRCLAMSYPSRLAKQLKKCCRVRVGSWGCAYISTAQLSATARPSSEVCLSLHHRAMRRHKALVASCRGQRTPTAHPASGQHGWLRQGAMLKRLCCLRIQSSKSWAAGDLCSILLCKNSNIPPNESKRKQDVLCDVRYSLSSLYSWSPDSAKTIFVYGSY